MGPKKEPQELRNERRAAWERPGGKKTSATLHGTHFAKRKTSATLHGSAPRKCETSATLHGNAFLHNHIREPAQKDLPKNARNHLKQTLLNVFGRSMGAPERARPKNGSAQVDASDRPEPWRKNERHAAWERSCARRNERHAAWERFSSLHGPFLPPKGERRILENKTPERQSGKTSPPHAAWERDFWKIYWKS